MCQGCYEEYGSPAIVTPRTIAAADLVRKVYESSCVGGHLHIMVDDWNLEDRHVQWCLQEVERVIADGGADIRLCAEFDCAKAFVAMTLDERASALALYDGYLVRSSPEPAPPVIGSSR